MFDVGADELLVITVVAILVIGPKDMPAALRTAGRWIGKIRRVSSHFRSGLDAMIREAEMEEMEKKWREQNRRVMEQHPSPEMDGSAGSGAAPLAGSQPENPVPVEAVPAAEVPALQADSLTSAEPAAPKPRKRKTASAKQAGG
jgi:sec-independent protein translocase protein TatB